MNIPYNIGDHIFEVNARNDKIEFNEYEITMITIKKDKSIKLRLTRMKERWSHEINASQLDCIDKNHSCYFTVVEEGLKYYLPYCNVGDN